MSIGNISDVNSTAAETVKLEAAAARTKGDLVRISTGGSTGVNVDVALADNTDVYRVAVANQDADSGDVYDAVVKGTVDVTVPSGTYTVGNGLHIVDGALADSGAAAEDASGESANNDVGTILVGGTTVTEITVTLHGFAVTAQT